jgi:hypothetical protein
MMRTNRIAVGQPAPHATLTTLDGESIELASLWRGGRHALLLFLRHLG